MSKIVFMGDSITEYMPYVFKGSIGRECDEIKYYGRENIGVGNYMNYIWPMVEQESADTYILLIGTNNVSRPDCDYDERESLDDLVDKLKEFIDKIVNGSSTRLLVQSIYPTKSPKSNEKILFVNEKIENYCNSIGVEYLNLYDLFENQDGLFDGKYSNDGIHPNELGYGVVAEEVNKVLRKEKYCDREN